MAFATPRNTIDSSSCIAKRKALKNTMWKQQNTWWWRQFGLQLCPLNVCNYMYLENEYLLNMVLQSTLSKVDSFGTLRVHLREMSFLQMVIKNIASTVRETGYESRQNIEVENNGAVRSCWKLPAACACTILLLVHKLWLNIACS